MSFRLKKHERCPIHNSYFCCGREKPAFRKHPKREKKLTELRGWYQVAPGVRRKNDPSWPDGFIERRSRSAMDELLKRKVREQGGCCCYCGEPFMEWSDVTPEHVEPRGCFGANRNDASRNIKAACAPCNTAKGSRRIS